MSSSLGLASGKPGIHCIVGNAESGIHWGYHVMKYLLQKMITNGQIKNIYYVAIEKDIIGMPEKVKVLSSFNRKDLLTSISTALQKMSEECSRERERESVVISSFSEIVLSQGILLSLQWLQSLYTVGYRNITLLLHSTLHTQIDIATIKNKCNIITSVLPNTHGVYNPKEVLVEVQIVYKSLHSGRVSEEFDLFGTNAAGTSLVLVPKLHSHRASAIESTHTSSTVESMPIETVSSSHENNLSNDSGTDSLEGVKIHTNKSNPLPSSHSNLNQSNRNMSAIAMTSSSTSSSGQPLVTFDMDDPEFEEDEDPDADLDL